MGASIPGRILRMSAPALSCGGYPFSSHDRIFLMFPAADPPFADYVPVEADELLRHDLIAIVRLSIAEDLADQCDWTTVLMVSDDARGTCQIRSRADGIAAGLVLLPWIVEEFDADLSVEVHFKDGDRFVAGDALATLSGNARDLLTSERTILNILCRTCGISTLTSQYVRALESGLAEATPPGSTRLYDTRKTTPGWRRMEKYSVRCGGGHNHRTGLYDGILIKDNHIALATTEDGKPMSLVEGVRQAIKFRNTTIEGLATPPIVEVEVDTLQQFDAVLPLLPNIILLDNFSLSDLRIGVARRNEFVKQANRPVSIELEASGNVRLETIAQIAATGVDRISSGALTHQAKSLDLGLDWLGQNATYG